MSIATQIQRLYTLRNNIKTKLKSLGILSENPRAAQNQQDQEDWVVVGNDIEACSEAILKIDGVKEVTTTATTNVVRNKYAIAHDPNLVPENIKDGETILGVTGTAQPGYTNNTSTNIITEGESVPYIDATRVYKIPKLVGNNIVDFKYPQGKDSFGTVNVQYENPHVCIPSNIRQGVTIHNTTGTYQRNLQRAYGYDITFSNSSQYSGDDKETYRTITFKLKHPNGQSVTSSQLGSISDIEYINIYMCDNEYTPGISTICRFVSKLNYSRPYGNIGDSNTLSAKLCAIYSKAGNVNPTYITNKSYTIQMQRTVYNNMVSIQITIPNTQQGWIPGFVNDAQYCLELIW